MIHEENFRSRAQIVRQSARAHLLDIRRARLAKRGPRADAELAGQVLEEHGPREHELDGKGEVDANDLSPVQPISESGTAPDGKRDPETIVPALAEAPTEPDAGASSFCTEKVDRAPDVDVAETFTAMGQHDDLDEIAHKNIVSDAAPLTEKEPPLRLTKPIVPGSTRGSISSVKPAAEKPATEKKVAKPKARRPVPGPSPEDDPEDRAVRNAALADLAEGPRPSAVARPVELPSTSPEDLDNAPPLGVSPEVATEDATAMCELPADLEGAEDAPNGVVVASEAMPAAFPPGPVQPEPTAEITGLTETIPAGPQSDLRSLPGAGPGLIWMLHQCDIHSLQDLARTEAAVLIPKLGLVGQILNVDIWLDYARKAQAPHGL